MFLIPVVVLLALAIGGFYVWEKRQSPAWPEVTASPPTEGAGRVSLLTEAVAYVGAILILAGGIAALGQRWEDMSQWAQTGVFAAAAVFFLGVGFFARAVREAAVQRLVGVVWFLSVGCVAGAVGFGMQDSRGTVIALTIGLATSVYAAGLWLLRKLALQNVALFLGLIVTIVGTIGVIEGDTVPALALGLSLWAFGLVWAALGWEKIAVPMWISTALGAVLALVAPAFAIPDHGWVFAVALTTAGVAMALSVPLQNTPLLGLGTLAMFGYLTWMVIQYFGESLGVPAALSVTGVLILLLAVVSARLLRMGRPEGPGERRKPRPPMFHHHGLPKPS